MVFIEPFKKQNITPLKIFFFFTLVIRFFLSSPKSREVAFTWGVRESFWNRYYSLSTGIQKGCPERNVGITVGLGVNVRLCWDVHKTKPQALFRP